MNNCIILGWIFRDFQKDRFLKTNKILHLGKSCWERKICFWLEEKNNKYIWIGLKCEAKFGIEYKFCPNCQESFLFKVKGSPDEMSSPWKWDLNFDWFFYEQAGGIISLFKNTKIRSSYFTNIFYKNIWYFW